MLFIIFPILLTTLTCQYYQTDTKKMFQNGYRENYIFDLVAKLTEYTERYSNQTIIYDYVMNKKECFNKLKGVISGTETLEIINYSGKAISDTGLEEDCKNRNYTYLFITYNLELPVFFNDSDYSSFYTFMNENSFYLGLCLYRECNEFYQNFLNENYNTIFFDHIREKGLTNLKLFRMDYPDNKDKEIQMYESNYMKLVIVFFYVFLFYIITRCIITFAGQMLYDKSDTSEQKDSIPEFSLSISSDELLERTNPSQPRRRVKGFFYRIYKILSLNNFKVLVSLKNKYFDDTNLEFLCGIRMYLLFLITFHQNVFGISRLPHRDFGGYSFYTSFWYFFAKFASYSCECLIALNGVILGYKLLNWYKYKSDGSVKSYLKFYFNFVTRIMVFILSFVFFHLFLKEVSYYFGNLTIFDYFIEKFVNNKECISKPWIMLIPFYLQYFIPYDSTADSWPCFKYSNFILSEFYCFTFILILFYILQKIKSRKLDLSVFILSLVNFLVLYFTFEQTTGNYYTFDDVLGELITFARPHIFYISYFFGFNVGVTYFYYKDVIYSHSTINEYKPFYYTFYFMKFIDTKSNFVKNWIICICIILQFIISLNFFIIIQIANMNNNQDESAYNILLEKGVLLDILTIYENKIYTLFFLFCLVTLLLYSKDLAIKNFFSASIFIPLNRINFTFFCIQDSIIYIFYAMYNIQIYSNIQNCLFVSFGLLIIIIITSLICYILFEMPFRLTYKHFVAEKRSKVRLK
jgi:hypothetical protein